jgi:fructokinase
MNSKKVRAVAYGEVLWDVFENKKMIGGAPLNVALRMKMLGCEVAMISCVGDDEDGAEILKYVKNLGLETTGIMQSEDFPTGLVNVVLNDKGSATYEIKYPAAWDKIVLNDFANTLVDHADVLIYGSLVCRDEISRYSLEKLLQKKLYKVFDVNLRKPHYSYEIIQKLMLSADFIKFNDDELLEISAFLKSPFSSLEENMYFMAENTEAKAICVTRGSHGALLLWKDQLYENQGYTVKVADTVGAGDSFLAALIASLLTGKKPQKSIDFACAMGGLVAQSHGANPLISISEIEKLNQTS